MSDVGVGRDGVEQQCAMAMGGLALHAQQGARPLARKLEHLRALRDRFWELELPGVDAF
jgi:hypothetical protein